MSLNLSQRGLQLAQLAVVGTLGCAALANQPRVEIVPAGDNILEVTLDVSNNADRPNSGTRRGNDTHYDATSGQAHLVYQPSSGIFTLYKTGNAGEPEKRLWQAQFSRLSKYGQDNAPGIEFRWMAQKRERIYGLGPSDTGLNRNGKLITIPAEQLRMPVLYSSNGYAIAIRGTPECEFDLNKLGHGWHLYAQSGTAVTFHLIVAENLDRLVTGYGKISPKQQSLPDWGYGVWLSDQGFDNQEEVLAIAQRMARRNMPLGVIQPVPGSRNFELERYQELAENLGLHISTKPAPVVWASDQPASWQALETLVEAGLSAGLSGQALWGCDVGGYRGKPEKELYLRWLQLGMFSPLVRLNGESPRVPWAFERDSVQVYEKLLSARLALQPTLAALGKEAVETGRPIMRAMEMVFPNEPMFAGEASQYMLGEHILVAPVVKEKILSRKVKFPPGRWQNLFEPIVYEGPAELTVPSTLEIPAVFLREDAKIKARVPADQQELKWDPDAPVRDFSFSSKRAVLRNLTVPRFASLMMRKAEISYELDAGATGKLDINYAKLPNLQRGKAKPAVFGQRFMFELDAPIVDRGTEQKFQIHHVRDGIRYLVHDGLICWMPPLRLTLKQPRDWILGQGTRSVHSTVWNASDYRLPFLVRTYPEPGIEIDPPVIDDWLEPNQSMNLDWQINANLRGAASVPTRFVLTSKADYQMHDTAVFSRPLSWVVAGPFQAAGEVPHYRFFGPSWRSEPEAGFADGQQLRRWEAVPESHVLANCGLNFNELFGPHTNAAAYAMTKIRSFVAQKAVLKLGTDDTLAVWVNGIKLRDREVYRTAEMDQDSISIFLEDGINTIIVKVAQRDSDWRLIARLTADREEFLTGVVDGFDDLEQYAANRPHEQKPINMPAPLTWYISHPLITNRNQPGPLDATSSADGHWPPEVDGVEWLDETAGAAYGVALDLSPWGDMGQDSYRYMCTTLSGPDPARLLMYLQTDHNVTLWLNGKQIHSRQGRNRSARVINRIKAALKPGDNRLIVKLGPGGNEHLFRLTVVDDTTAPQRPLGATLTR
jgi:hypothetical protein